nr:hypothetical protein [Tanacetum cinerariifolium]
MIAILEKTEHNIDFHQIVDFLEASHIRYALIISPTIHVSHIRQFWSTARVETTNLETKILIVDGKPRTISESSLRRHLKLNDEEGISSLPDTELFENLSLMGYNILPNQIFTFQKGQFSHQWKENINKTSTLPHELSPRVTSLDADEGNQDLVISSLKERVKFLEDKDRGSAEPTQEDAPIKGGIMEIWEEVGAEKSTKLGSNETEEMVNVLSSIEDANILTSTVAAASVSPAAGVPTVSGSFPTASAIFTTASVKVVESEIPKKRKFQEQLDTQVAREMEEEFAKENKRLSEQLARDSEIARLHAEEELKGMTLEEIKEKFIPVWKQLEDFVPMFLKEEGERVKRNGLKLDQGSAKRMKTSEDVSEEDLKGMMQLVPLEDVYIEAMQTLVKETLSIKQATKDKENELWVELKRLFEPDFKDQLWTHNQALMHDPLEWKLYDTCVLKTVQDEEMIEASSPARRWIIFSMIVVSGYYGGWTGWRFEGDIKLFVVDVRLIRTLEVDVGLFGVAASVTFMPCFRREMWPSSGERVDFEFSDIGKLKAVGCFECRCLFVSYCTDDIYLRMVWYVSQVEMDSQSFGFPYSVRMVGDMTGTKSQGNTHDDYRWCFSTLKERVHVVAELAKLTFRETLREKRLGAFLSQIELGHYEDNGLVSIRKLLGLGVSP